MRLTSKPKLQVKLTVYGAGNMDPAQRKQIAAWLRREAHDLAAEGGNYAPRYTARKFGG